MHHSEEAFVSANGLQLCYDTFGEQNDPPMVLVMGLASQLILWDDDFCRLLAAQGRYVVRFDNRDIGRSTYLDELPVPNLPVGFVKHFVGMQNVAAYTLIDMARDTVALLDALGFDTVNIVGASMGGAIVQELAIHFPQRFRSITTIMASTGDPRLPQPKIDAFGALMKKPPRDREGYLAHYEQLWTALSGDGYPIDPVRTRRQGELAYARGIHPAGAARQFGAILASGNRTAALRSIRLPTLVIQGLNDPLIRPEHGRALAAAIPGAKLEMVTGMGHTLPERCWPQIVGAIEAHTAALDRSSTIA